MGKYYRNSYITLMNFCKYQGGWRQTEKFKYRLKREIIKIERGNNYKEIGLPMGKYYRNSYLTLMNFCKYQGGWRQTEKLKYRLKIERERIKIEREKLYRDRSTYGKILQKFIHYTYELL